MPSDRAVDRLDAEKRHQLDNLIASWRMENMPLGDAEIDILARSSAISTPPNAAASWTNC
jgi:hypothetical protein